MARSILNPIFSIIVMLLLNGCFFFSDKEAQQWVINPQGVDAAALSRNGRFVLSYSKDQSLILWDLFENSQLAVLGQQDDKNTAIKWIRWSDNGRYAITASDNNFVIWDLGVSQALGLWSISDGQILSVDIANNGQQVLLGLSNHKAIYIDIATERRIEFLAHQARVNSVALSANGRFALSAGNDDQAYLWNTQSGKIQRTFAHRHNIMKVALQRDGERAFTSDIADGHFIWDLHNGERLSQLDISNKVQQFSNARFSDDGKQLITTTNSGKLTLWNTQNGERLQTWNTQPQIASKPLLTTIYDAAFISQQRIVSANASGIIQAWMTKL